MAPRHRGPTWRRLLGELIPYAPRDTALRDPRDPRQGTPPLLPYPEWDTPPDVIVRPRLTPIGEGAQGAEGAPPPGMPGAGPPLTLPPWLFPPANSFAFDQPSNRMPVVIPAGGSLVVTLPRVPLGSTGVVSRIGISTTSAADTRITTRINTNPVPPWGNVFGAVSALEDPTDLPAPILLRGSDEFSVLMENVGAVAVNMAARILGWWYSGA